MSVSARCFHLMMILPSFLRMPWLGRKICQVTYDCIKHLIGLERPGTDFASVNVNDSYIVVTVARIYGTVKVIKYRSVFMIWSKSHL